MNDCHCSKRLASSEYKVIGVNRSFEFAHLQLSLNGEINVTEDTPIRPAIYIYIYKGDN